VAAAKWKAVGQQLHHELIHERCLYSIGLTLVRKKKPMSLTWNLHNKWLSWLRVLFYQT